MIYLQYIFPDEKVRELRGLFSTLKHLADSSEHMSEFYQRMKAGKSAGKSRMALIRKIIVSSYHMLNKNKNITGFLMNNMIRN